MTSESSPSLLLTLSLLALCLCGGISAQGATSLPQVNATGAPYVVNPSGFTSGISVTTTADQGNRSQQCQLETIEEARVRDELKSFLVAGAKLVEMTLFVEGYPEGFLDDTGGVLFHGSKWVRSTSRRGRSLLMLEENYDMLSLNLLTIGVEHMKVGLRDVPAGCLNRSSPDATETLLRELLLNDFSSKPGGTSSLSKDEHVCNVHIVGEHGKAVFYHTCCHRDPNGGTRCAYVYRDVWTGLLLACVLLIKVLVVLFSPNFLPESLYSEKYTAQEYIYEPKADKTIRVVVTKYPSSYTGKNVIKLSALAEMQYFRRTLSMMNLDKVYEMQLHKIRLAVKGRRLLSENNVPIGFIRMLYTNIMRCKIRKLPAFAQCCQRSVCGSLTPSFRVLPWYKFLRAMMRLVLVLLLLVPWILRLTAFYTVEGERMERRFQAAERRGLAVDFRGSFTLFLTPLHGLFVAVYVVVLIDSFIYGIIRKRMKNKFKLILRKCLRDMRGRSRLSVCSWACRVVLKPFELFGLFGLLLIVPYVALLSPLLLVVMVFYLVPFVNLSGRLIIHMFIFICPNRFNDWMDNMTERMDRVKKRLNLEELSDLESFEKKKDISTCDVLLHILILGMCLTSFWSVTFLLMECLAFFVEIGVYTMVGVIVNADVVVRYLTVLFFLYLYASNTLGAVRKKYVAFHNSILSELVKRKKAELEIVSSQDSTVQENTVFRVKGYIPEATEEEGEETSPPEVGEANVPEARFAIRGGRPTWITRSLLIFLDSLDQPRCPEKLFHGTISMPYCGCPGAVSLSYAGALMELLKIVIFLVFVIIVVMAFGDAYSISSSNQMLATVAGGFLPFMFRNIFKSGSGSPSLDTESLQFKSELNNVIAKFEQCWPVWDLVPTHYKEVSNRFSVSADMDLPQATTSTPVESKGENSHNVTDRVFALALEESQVNLIVDISTFDERHFGTMNRSGTTGSISMLADTGRGAEDVRIYRDPNVREVEIV